MSGIYKVLKRVFKYSIYQYFSEIKVMNKELIPANKPIIFIPNHRSAFMDPIVVACLLPNEMNFLTRGESFQNPTLAKIFSRLNMIPIYRKDYSPDDVHKNDDVFKYCYELLERKGSLMIFPEGLCQTKFLLAPLKTGTARIALGAEKKNQYELDLHIVPVGINYTHPHIFRSRLLLDIGDPFSIKALKEDYESDPESTVRALTSRMEAALKSKIVTLHSSSDDQLIRQMEQLYQADPDLSMDSWYEQRQFIAAGLNYFRDQKPDELNTFTNRLRNHLRKYAIVDPESAVGTDVRTQLAIKGNWWKLITLLITLPVYLVGCLTHLVPFLLTKVIAYRVVKRSDFAGSVILALGVLLFSIFLFGESLFIHRLFDNWLLTVAFVLIWPSLGLFTYIYGATARVFIRKLKIMTSSRLQIKKQSLQAERTQLISELKLAIEEFKATQNRTATSS
ncbi:MAG: 1-acyl-sn-glycerol-3-phosphate acyltransferase [Bacteroidetes bacterium]|nr:1-acyl-sn-glycerol-3-phosphate acyltransferase [Bacteroidota bacterium]